MKRGIQIAGVTAVHFVLTIAVSFGAWAVQGEVTTTALLQFLAPVSYVLNFPIPFLFCDNSILIMFCNSTLFGVVAVLILALLRNVRKHQAPGV